MNNKKQKPALSGAERVVPKLRFPEFQNDGVWAVEKLSNLGKLVNGLTYSPKDVCKEGLLVLRSSNVQNGQILLDDCVFVRPDVKGANLAEPNDILICVRNGSKRLIGKNAIIPKNLPLATHGAFMTIFRANNASFVFQLFQTESYTSQVKADLGATINSINGKNFIKYEFAIPKNPKEQQKIADCLSSLDTLITAETDKLAHLKDHKKGLLQQLFPADGETQPKYRFPEFKKDGDWEETTLDKCLDYLQPTPYLVSSTAYNDKYETPVLTAGKTFILGYTIEKEGIFSNDLPVIIFDDFTTATKFVNFPFKVKSSAMKILLAKDNNNIQFLFETIQNLNFEVSTHKRHWISIYSKLDILKPRDPKEQQKIADCLSTLDEAIEAQNQKIAGLKEHKKGLMQQMFPTINELAV